MSTATGATHFIIAGSLPTGQVALDGSGPRTGTGVVFFNRAYGDHPVEIAQLWPQNVPLVSNLGDRAFSETIAQINPASAWSVSHDGGPPSYVHFVPDIPIDELSLVMINADGTAQLVQANGASRSAANATGTDDQLALPPEDIGIRALFPNPASHTARLSIHTNGSSPSEIRVVDILGRIVWRKSVPMNGSSGNQDVTLPISEWAAGMYVIEVSSKDGLTRDHQTLIVAH